MDLTARLVQIEVQHLVLGTADPASHSSPVSIAPFPQTGALTTAPEGWTGGGAIGVAVAVF